MICQLCNKRDARFEIVEIVSNKRKSIFCCQSCRDKYQSKEFDTFYEGTQNKTNAASKMCCPKCNQLLDEVFKNRELGCEVCFNQFREYIDQIASNFSHVGKAPIKKTIQIENRITLTDIETRLENAIKNEDFKLAQELKEIRDRLLNK